MSKIEPVNPEVTEKLPRDIKDFWTRNVNAEKLMGKDVSTHQRGNEAYFTDLEKQRYRSHAHLTPWINSMEPGRSVLEIGCGIGMDSFQMASRGMQLTAIDLTDVAIEIASKRFKDNGLTGQFEQGDATNLRFNDNSFDYVYSFGVLHHTQDTEKSIREVFRVLKKGGKAKIMLYNRHSLNELVHRITKIPFEDRDELCPVVRRFTLTEIQTIFAPFSELEVHRDFVFGEGYGLLRKLTPGPIYRALSNLCGWHLMITATK